MCCHPHHVLGVAVHHVLAGDARLEPERRALDRRFDSVRRHVGQHVRHIDGVLGALLGAPVRLVNLFLDDRVLERSVGKGIDRVEVHVVVGQKFLQPISLGLAVDQRGGGGVGEAQRHAEPLARRNARLHLGHVGGQARPHVVPGVAGMHQCRIGEMADALAEIHELLRELLVARSGLSVHSRVSGTPGSRKRLFSFASESRWRGDARPWHASNCSPPVTPPSPPCRSPPSG